MPSSIWSTYSVDALTALKASLTEAIAAGVTSVSYNGQSLNYQDVGQMRKTAREIQAELDTRSGRRGAAKRVIFRTGSRGFR